MQTSKKMFTAVTASTPLQKGIFSGSCYPSLVTGNRFAQGENNAQPGIPGAESKRQLQSLLQGLGVRVW